METGVALNYVYWGQFYTLEVWEIAVMMQGFDPRAFALGEVIVKDNESSYGQTLDISEQEKLLISALLSGRLEFLTTNQKVPGRDSSIKLSQVIPWLEDRGFIELASGLKVASLSYQKAEITPKIPDPERRLKALEDLGGEAKWRRYRNGSMAWSFTKIGELTKQEASNGYSRCDEKTIRKDLIFAAEERSKAKRDGVNNTYRF